MRKIYSGWVYLIDLVDGSRTTQQWSYDVKAPLILSFILLFAALWLEYCLKCVFFPVHLKNDQRLIIVILDKLSNPPARFSRQKYFTSAKFQIFSSIWNVFSDIWKISVLKINKIKIVFFRKLFFLHTNVKQKKNFRFFWVYFFDFWRKFLDSEYFLGNDIPRHYICANFLNFGHTESIFPNCRKKRS